MKNPGPGGGAHTPPPPNVLGPWYPAVPAGVTIPCFGGWGGAHQTQKKTTDETLRLVRPCVVLAIGLLFFHYCTLLNILLSVKRFPFPLSRGPLKNHCSLS